MIVSKEEPKHVEFISYTGKYPNLCRGVLTLKIDGFEYKFGHDSYDWEAGKYKDNNFNSFWRSGGGLDDDYIPIEREWLIEIEEIPDRLRMYALEIDRVFNDNVPFGCCGGCS